MVYSGSRAFNNSSRPQRLTCFTDRAAADQALACLHDKGLSGFIDEIEMKEGEYSLLYDLVVQFKDFDQAYDALCAAGFIEGGGGLNGIGVLKEKTSEVSLRKQIVELAKNFVTGKVKYKDFIRQAPSDITGDQDLDNLLSMIEHWPKKGGWGGLTEEKYQQYVSDVNRLIGKLSDE